MRILKYIAATLVCFNTSINLASAQEKDILLFTSGKTKTYNTADNPKAEGLNVSVTYPETWTAIEGERPNVVQKFQDKGSDANITIGLVIKEFPVDVSVLSDSELKDVYMSPEAQNKMAASGMKILNVNITKHKGDRAVFMDYHNVHEKNGFRGGAASMELQVFYKERLIGLQIMVMGQADEIDSLDKTLSSFTPLFFLVSESLTINDK